MPTKKASKRITLKRKDQLIVGCFFCKEKKDPNYKEYKELEKFLTDRAKIIGKKRTGLCSKHQRALSVSIKRARHLGLLLFTPTLK